MWQREISRHVGFFLCLCAGVLLVNLLPGSWDGASLVFVLLAVFAGVTAVLYLGGRALLVGARKILAG